MIRLASGTYPSTIVIPAVYLSYLCVVVALVFLPWPVLVDLSWWKRASIASLIYTGLAALSVYILVWAAPKLAVGQQTGMAIAPPLLFPVVVAVSILLFRPELAINPLFHLVYALLVALFFTGTDYFVRRGLTQSAVSDHNAEIFLNTLTHIDLPNCFACLFLGLFYILGSLLSAGHETDHMETFIAGALTFQLALANTAYLITHAQLDLW